MLSSNERNINLIEISIDNAKQAENFVHGAWPLGMLNTWCDLNIIIIKKEDLGIVDGLELMFY